MYICSIQQAEEPSEKKANKGMKSQISSRNKRPYANLKQPQK